MMRLDIPARGVLCRTNAELAGFIVAVGFVVMGVVGIPIVKWFLLGAILLGGVVVLLLRFARKE